LTTLLDQADLAALQGDLESLSLSLAGMAERLFDIRPFKPEEDLPANWRELLHGWLAGTDVVTVSVYRRPRH
ncbi:MAG TPA: hypothetical protein VNH21_15445, partial [Steroidobacteraceae bacterium]|nr:hypothetical protein [Steroidobacteraceae bacterium]